MPTSSKHPRRDHHGREVVIDRPSIASPLGQWLDPSAIAVAVPEGAMVASLHGLTFERWAGPGDWGRAGPGEDVLGRFEEPPFEPPSGLAPATGVVTLEPDGRVWLVAPTNGYGGYRITFPKGKAEPGLGHRVGACKEAWEESGLRVALTGFLADVPRSTSFARYYLARRIGGTPIDMGWESQAVWLVPRPQLAGVANHANDRSLLAALAALAAPA